MGRLLRTCAAAIIVIVLACIPLPSGEKTTGRIVPGQETPIYLATGGHLERIFAEPGEEVSEGQMIAQLSHPTLEYQYAKAKARYETQLALVSALRSSQASLDDVANELPAAEALLVELERQVSSKRSRLEALAIRAPTSGRLIVGPTRQPDSGEEIRLVGWTGHGLEPANRGCFFEAGTELAAIAEEDSWVAELTVPAVAASRVAVGNEVKLLLESKPSHVIRGVVSDISLKQWTVAENQQRRDDSGVTQQNAPPEVSYAVRVSLQSPSDAVLTGAEVIARISTQPRSVASRITSALSRLMRFR